MSLFICLTFAFFCPLCVCVLHASVFYDAFAVLCMLCLSMCALLFCFVCVCVCVWAPPLLTAARSKTAGERAAQAALPSHSAHRARLRPAPDPHSFAGEGSDTGGQRAPHPSDSQHHHPVHPIDALDTGPGEQRQVCPQRAGGAEGAGGEGREPRPRKRFRVLRG